MELKISSVFATRLTKSFIIQAFRKRLEEVSHKTSSSKSKKILTVGVVTLPFSFEGKRRMRAALQGVATLRENTATLLVIPNARLLEATDRSTSFKDAFHMVDEVLVHAIQGITDLLNGVGDINVDFADMQTVMEGMGRAVIG